MSHTFSSALLNSLTFSLLGIAILVITFVIIEKITPENMWKEVVKEKNTAVAILGGALVLAIAIIIAAAIHG